MGALSWLTVSINAHHFVTDVLSGRFQASILVLLASLRLANFQHYFVGIPVYGNIVIQNTAPETADADNAFVSAFKQCIIGLSKHVQTVRECVFHLLILHSSRFEQYYSKGLLWNPNGSPFS